LTKTLKANGKRLTSEEEKESVFELGNVSVEKVGLSAVRYSVGRG